MRSVEVTIRIAANADDKRSFGGYGADNDIIVASVKAYLAALNRMVAVMGQGDRKPEGDVATVGVKAMLLLRKVHGVLPAVSPTEFVTNPKYIGINWDICRMTMNNQAVPRTLFEKVWENHLVRPQTPDTPAVLYIDLHLVHEVTSPQAFTVLRERGLKVRRPDRTLATMDHSTPTTPRNAQGIIPVTDSMAAAQLDVMRKNCADFGIPLYDLGTINQGIVHVIGPEQGYTQPGMTIVAVTAIPVHTARSAHWLSALARAKWRMFCRANVYSRADRKRWPCV